MPGQRIYYVPPRLVGAFSDWSGKDSVDGDSWLLNHAADMGFNAIWMSPMCQTTQVEKIAHGRIQTGSYYAIRDHFSYDPEFSAGQGDAEDILHMQHFCAKAAEKGVRVFADLVFNHVAADHPLVEQENREIADIVAQAQGNLRFIHGHKNKLIGVCWDVDGEEKAFFFKFRRNRDLSLQFGGPAEDPWTDVAQINYSSPEARRFFVTGDETHSAYFKQVIDWHLNQGITGFRCDAAYLIPPEAWRELIGYMHEKQPDIVTLAETLCTTHQKVERLAQARITDENGVERPAFDLGMLGIYWWNFEDKWLPEDEHDRVLTMSKYGGAGSPDTHDTEGTLAGNLRRAFNHVAQSDGFVAGACVRDYAVSVLACNSSYMQMGFEYGNEKQNHVFAGMVSPSDWEKLVRERGDTEHPLNMTARIRAINALKESLGVENCRVDFAHHSVAQDGRLVEICCTYYDADTNIKKAEVVLLINKHPELGSVPLRDSQVSGMQENGYESLTGGKAVDDILVWHKTFDDGPSLHFMPPAAAFPKQRQFRRFGDSPGL